MQALAADTVKKTQTHAIKVFQPALPVHSPIIATPAFLIAAIILLFVDHFHALYREIMTHLKIIHA